MGNKTIKEKPLWKCPKCNRHFANCDQSHSCVKASEEDFLKGRSAHEVALYRTFVKELESIGPILLAPAKTRVGFQVRMIFAAANKLSNGCLDAHVVLARRLEKSRFRKIETVSPRNHVHHFRIERLEDFDTELREWFKEAYSVGKQEH
ncbi:MAG: DUF5655 domain-containing protein [Candidatus Wallbacteria bacterium]|nr:DUF5655 domain-containing protein [Candidatus Wallbacteria bacterium]